MPRAKLHLHHEQEGQHFVLSMLMKWSQNENGVELVEDSSALDDVHSVFSKEFLCWFILQLEGMHIYFSNLNTYS